MTQVLDNFHAGMLPAESKQRLEYYSQLQEKHHWGVAKEVGYILAELAAEDVEVPRMKLYAAVAEVSRDEPESVRMWYGVYEKIPKDIYKSYVVDNDLISFHQFKALVPHVKTFGRERSQDFERLIVDWFDHCSEVGRSPSSVSGMRTWIAGEYGAPSPEVGKYKRHIKVTLQLAGNESVPQPIRNEMVRHKDALTTIVDKYMLDEDWRPEDA